jgi:hypothetical protein
MDALSNLILRGSLDKLSAFLAEKLLVAYDKQVLSYGLSGQDWRRYVKAIIM